jgi:hypothetical protein
VRVATEASEAQNVVAADEACEVDAGAQARMHARRE